MSKVKSVDYSSTEEEMYIYPHQREQNQINVHYCKFKTGFIDHDVVNEMAGM